MIKFKKQDAELSELEVLISDAQDLLKQVPGDSIVEFQLEQLKHRQDELNRELRALSIIEKKHKTKGNDK
jgi:hypothetical protein